METEVENHSGLGRLNGMESDECGFQVGGVGAWVGLAGMDMSGVSRPEERV